MTLQEQLDAINNAIARQGHVVRVRQANGSEVQYTGLREMLDARDRLTTELNAVNRVGMYVPIAFREPC